MGYLVKMSHAYSTDSPERRYIPFFLAGGAIAAAFWTAHLVSVNQIALPWWLSPPLDTMAFYGGLYWLFDQFIWKWPLLRRLKITRTPNLAGTWTGVVRPSAANGASQSLGTETAIAVDIQQTWTHLSITGRTAQYRSHSLSGSLITVDECSISYEYINEPLAVAPVTMHAHRGTAMLAIDKSLSELEGEYYSGRDRQNIGAISLRRIGSATAAGR